MPSGNYAPSCVECFAGPLTSTGSSQLPVTVLKTYQKTYTNTRSLAIPDGSTTGTGSPGKTATSTISVADAGMIVDVNIKFSIAHPNDSDLQGWLNGPNGAVSGLFNRIGGSGDNLTNTMLDDEAPSGIFIDSASTPFTGSFRPEGWLANLDGGSSNGTWAFSLCDYVKGNKGTLNNWSITVTYGIGPAALSASTIATGSTAPALNQSQLQPLVQEATARWQAASLTPQQAAVLHGVNVRIGDLGKAILGMVSGNTIWIDDYAAGWGWFVDPAPRDDYEFTTPGDQGEQGHMDLLTVLTHEMGHLLGLEHSSTSGDVMGATLIPGVRLMLTASDLLGSTLAEAPSSGSNGVGNAQSEVGIGDVSYHALEATDAVFAELAQWTDHERQR